MEEINEEDYIVPDTKVQVCHWDEETNSYIKIWVPNLEDHLDDERYSEDRVLVDGHCE